MPPSARSRPPKAVAERALKSISDSLIAGEAARRKRDGRRTVRRLNRIEFENTLRDLLDLPWLEVRDLIPDDGRDGGYTKTAVALDVSPVLLAKYGEAIDKALQAAVAKWAVPPASERRVIYANQQYDFKVLLSGGDAVMLTPEMKYDETRFPMPSATDADGPYPTAKWSFGGKYKDLGVAERAGAFDKPSTVGMTRTFGEAFQGRFDFAPIHPGRYRVAVSAWSYWWDKGVAKPAPRSGAVGVYCGSRLVGFFDAPSLRPTTTESFIDVDPKENNNIRAAGASFLDAHVYFSQGQVKAYSGPGVAIDRIEIEGPLYDEWPPASHRRLFGNLPVEPFRKLPEGFVKPSRELPRQRTLHSSNGPGRIVPGATVPENPPADARRLLASFLPRAFRRSVAAEEVERFAAVFDARLKSGAAFEDAMLEAYRTALLSPEFLFLMEPAGKLDDFSLASRVSYFLWNSCPDDALLAAAKAGKLKTPSGLKAETERLFADAKVDRLYQDFLEQWLDLRDFDSTSPDKQLYPEFHPYLDDAMRREPVDFFRHLVEHNLPSTTLVATPINLVNQRLSEHYRLPNPVEGTRFRRVDVDQNKMTRGGLLTMAAVLKVTANGTTTSPAKRGAWVMRKILGAPPQPPPPDIPAIEPDVRGATTIREQLARHRSQAVCAACHAKFDPPGFALESFDPIGGLRSRYRATEGKRGADLKNLYPGFLGPEGKFGAHFFVGFKDGPPVDSSGELVGGKKFTDLRDYQNLILEKPRDFSRNLANQLILYSTGARVGFADRAAVEEALNKAGGDNPPLKNLILEVILSPLFESK